MDQLPSSLFENELLRKAADASSEGITISIMSEPDRPLIYVNDAFQRLTGYSREEVIGKNCRFLQGNDTDPYPVNQLRAAIQKEEACTVELLNYRKDGTPFWNRLSITPILDANNEVTHYVGIQSDITQIRKTKERLESANQELRMFQQNILKEMEQARIAQQFILPAALPTSKKVKFASKFRPMAEIGGDFYDVLQLSPETYGMLIADVTGHGIPAALLTFMSSTTFKQASVECQSPAKTIALTNERLFRKMPDDAFVTMFYIIYDAESKVLRYTQAGHPEAYVLRRETEEVIPLSTGGTLIGAFSNKQVSFVEKEINLVHGDKLLLYTDAITDIIEKFDSPDEVLTMESILQKFIYLSLENLFDELFQIGLERSGFEAYPDDFTLLGMEVL